MKPTKKSISLRMMRICVIRCYIVVIIDLVCCWFGGMFDVGGSWIRDVRILLGVL